MQSNKGGLARGDKVTYTRAGIHSPATVARCHYQVIEESANQTGRVGLEMHIDQCSTGWAPFHINASSFVCDQSHHGNLTAPWAWVSSTRPQS
jgi:hypothetical protein